MGLFENDSYRDHYQSFDDAMHNCYVSPYGEVPFDRIDIPEEEFAVSRMYPFQNLQLQRELPNIYAAKYIDRILQKINAQEGQP